MTIVLKFIISCEALNLLVFFYGTCFGHVVSKATQYATNDDKIFKDLAQLVWNMHKHLSNLTSHGQKVQVYWQLNFFQCKYLWVVNYEMYNKIDFLLSLFIISKGAKEWKQTCLKFVLLERKFQWRHVLHPRLLFSVMLGL
jgi:hypothetical protein